MTAPHPPPASYSSEQCGQPHPFSHPRHTMNLSELLDTYLSK